MRGNSLKSIGDAFLELGPSLNKKQFSPINSRNSNCLRCVWLIVGIGMGTILFDWWKKVEMLSLNVIKPRIRNSCLRSIEESRSSFVECDSSLNERQFCSINWRKSNFFRSVRIVVEREIILFDQIKKVEMFPLSVIHCWRRDNSLPLIEKSRSAFVPFGSPLNEK